MNNIERILNLIAYLKNSDTLALSTVKAVIAELDNDIKVWGDLQDKAIERLQSTCEIQDKEIRSLQNMIWWRAERTKQINDDILNGK